MENKKNIKWLYSSINPNQISNRVRGAVLALAGALILVGNALGVPLTEEGIAILAGQAGAAAGSLWFFWGLLMWVVSKVTGSDVREK